MANTKEDFGKKRDHNQYGDTKKDPSDQRKIEDSNKSPNKGIEKEKTDDA